MLAESTADTLRLSGAVRQQLSGVDSDRCRLPDFSLLPEHPERDSAALRPFAGRGLRPGNAPHLYALRKHKKLNISLI